MKWLAFYGLNLYFTDGIGIRFVYPWLEIPLQSTIYNLQSTIYNLQSTIYNLQFTIYNLHINGKKEIY